jgi:soluble P-type ATPase
MLRHDIPGFGPLRIEHLVLDYNGTLALDGRLIPGVRPRLRALARLMKLHVVTADTFGTVRRALRGVPCRTAVLGAQGQDRAKRDFVRRLGAARTVCIGNGRNDRLMLRAARLGLVVVESEGAAGEAVMAADVVSPSIVDALDLLLHPLRLTATLRT